MKSFKNIKRGLEARAQGLSFEKILTIQAQTHKVIIKKIPENEKIKRVRGNLFIIRKPSIVDFILAYKGKVIFFDAKTIETGNFSYSKFNHNQLTHLLDFNTQGIKCGLIIYYRDVNKVIFHDFNLIKKIKPRESLSKETGFFLGNINNFDLSLLFK